MGQEAGRGGGREGEMAWWDLGGFSPSSGCVLLGVLKVGMCSAVGFLVRSGYLHLFFVVGDRSWVFFVRHSFG